MKHFDYSRGLKAPFTHYKLLSPQKENCLVFCTTLKFSLFSDVIFRDCTNRHFWKFVPLPLIFGINLNLMIMLYFPNKVARWYTETEFEGKTGLAF